MTLWFATALGVGCLCGSQGTSAMRRDPLLGVIELVLIAVVGGVLSLPSSAVGLAPVPFVPCWLWMLHELVVAWCPTQAS